MNTRRRCLAAGAAWPALAWTGALLAQAKSPVVVGWLGADTHQVPKDFAEGMAALGWKVGIDYVLEDRHAKGQLDRLPALAKEIAARQAAVVVASTSTAARAAAAAAPTTPIVLTAGDPLASGLVTSLARPGGLITGLSNMSGDTNQKVAALLVEAMPKMRRIGFLADSTVPAHGANLAHARRAAEHSRVEALVASLAKPDDIEPAMARLARDNAHAVVILASAWFAPYFPRIIESAREQRWPVAGSQSGIARLGGLFNFGPDYRSLVRRSASYVDRILKGAKPGDLPIEQPTAFDLVLNLKTARQLGINLPQSMLVRATEVIE